MDIQSLTSPLKHDVFRVTAVVVVPGLIVVSSWSAWVLWPSLLDVDTWKNGGIGVSLLLLFSSIACGMILEDLGSMIELYLIDRSVADELDLKRDEFYQVWQDYLRTKKDDSLVVSGYLSHMVTRFKF